ncbi:hypothetical protein EVAR_36892_1 [Eumeta japonica]|uniref:Uncharacterized protein n=1 Tax=Eumeta variegata TaxID=151549 RepID=A0A4C1WUV9_EUMVA|nr:hypothetical protein EVAR_36892_1 [Eumeta japonica]
MYRRSRPAVSARAPFYFADKTPGKYHTQETKGVRTSFSSNGQNLPPSPPRGQHGADAGSLRDTHAWSRARARSGEDPEYTYALLRVEICICAGRRATPTRSRAAVSAAQTTTFREQTARLSDRAARDAPPAPPAPLTGLRTDVPHGRF